MKNYAFYCGGFALLQMYTFVSVIKAMSTEGPKINSLSSRRGFISGGFTSVIATSIIPNIAYANDKSRTDGYEIQKTASEWRSMLTPVQYDILRNGATERPNSSILESEERKGEYSCAGCGTPLFDGAAKFHSGTGWPSFATALSGVEVEDVSAIQAGLVGAELRCRTCGGHLGDVFQDGFLFLNTPAFVSGKRYCIDGAALVFKPADGSNIVIGDQLPPKKDLPGFLSPPKITPR